MSKVISARVGKREFRVKDCRGLSSIRGLMFDSMEDKDGALIYANSIWMPFVKRDLELHFLDKDKKVIDVQHAVPMTLNPKTWKVYSNPEAEYCLELKAGAGLGKGEGVLI